MKNKTKALAILAVAVSLVFLSGCIEKQPVQEKNIPAPKINVNPDPSGRISNDQLTVHGAATKIIYSEPGQMEWQDQYHLAVSVRNNADFPVSYERAEITFTKGDNDCSYARVRYFEKEANEPRTLASGETAYFDVSTTNSAQRLESVSRQELKLTVRLFHNGVQINDGYVAKIPPKKELPSEYENQAAPYALNFEPIISGPIGC